MFVCPVVAAVDAIRLRKKRPKALISKCPQPGSKATFAKRSGASSVEKPLLQLARKGRRFTPVAALGRVFSPMMLAGTNAADYVVSVFSTAKAAQILLLKFFVTRKALCRVQVKPTTYWPSCPPGLSSANVAMPCSFVVRRDHI